MMAQAQTKPFDSGDQHQVETRAKRIKIAEQATDNEFRAMMDVPQFRAFMWGLLTRTHVFAISADVTNANNTFFREGERNVGLSLIADVMRLCPEKYQTMAAEAAKREETING